MTHNPTVSQFNLQEPQHQPPHLSNTHHIQYAHAIDIKEPKEYTTPITMSPSDLNNLTNALNTSLQEKQEQNSEGIRKHIDACLNAIQSAYSQNRIRKSTNLKPNQPVFEDRTIHRIDTNLVLEYIRTICKDYKLRDRFGNTQTQIKIPLSHQRQPEHLSSPTQRQRTQSVGIEGRSRKQYLHLTQNSKLDRKGFSTQKKKIEQPTSPRSHLRSHSIHQSPQVASGKIKFAHSTNVRATQSPKIQQDFRYCINCQASILSKNVDFHQKYECKNCSSLYQMNFSQLTAFVGDKLTRINRELKKKLQWLKQRDLSKSRYENICNQTLQRIEEYANESTLNTSFEKNNMEYQKFKDSLNNDYVEVVKLTHKLHWFNQVYLNLKSESQKRREGSIVMELSSFTPTIPPSYQQTKVVPPSPISQLYPHLHRQPFNPPRPFNHPT